MLERQSLNASDRDQLYQAAKDENTKLAKQLIKQGAKLDAEIIELLLDTERKNRTYKPSTNPHEIIEPDFMSHLSTHPRSFYLVCNQSDTLLHWAAFNGLEEMIKLLIQCGADVNEQDNDGQTPARWATEAEKVAAIKLLAEHGAKLDIEDFEGITPLCWAIRENKLESVRALLENGADVNATDKDGSTPLHSAVKTGEIKMVELLLDNGAKINARDASGYTPLHVAAHEWDIEIVELLAQHGADFSIKDNEERTPADLASSSPHWLRVLTLSREQKQKQSFVEKVTQELKENASYHR